MPVVGAAGQCTGLQVALGKEGKQAEKGEESRGILVKRLKMILHITGTHR